MSNTQYALSAIRKNGFLVYCNKTGKEMVIRKRSDYKNDDEFKKYVLTFGSKTEAEDFIKDNKLVSIEVKELE